MTSNGKKSVIPKGLPLATYPTSQTSHSPATSPEQTEAKAPSRWKTFLKGAGELLDAVAAGSPAGMTQYGFNLLEEEREAKEALMRSDQPPPPPPPPASKSQPDGIKKGFWERFDNATDEMTRTYHRGGLLANPTTYAEADARIKTREDRDKQTERLRSQTTYPKLPNPSGPETSVTTGRVAPSLASRFPELVGDDDSTPSTSSEDLSL